MTKAVTIDVSTVASGSELHALLAESLSFPSFYGKNWDAFWDSITLRNTLHPVTLRSF